MRKILLSLLLVGAMALPNVCSGYEPPNGDYPPPPPMPEMREAWLEWHYNQCAQCGPWGCPTQRQPAPRVKVKPNGMVKIRRPTPAWRYERAVGYRAAVVRIHCWEGGGRWGKGSGVLVRWGKRVVVITARHVVVKAKRVLVDFHNGKRRKARVLKVNVRWDCAVLDIGAAPAGIEPARMAFGNDATFQNGDRLESCGYGADDKLASNSGLFKGYRRSSAAMQGPDDWMVISGHARQGDSGGPVFDSKGRVVGVLWGTDGREVVCVQPGRIHVMLDEVIAEQLAITNRRPTPPALGPLESVIFPDRKLQQPNAGCCPDGQCDINQAGLAGRDKTLLPWRKGAEAKDNSQDARIEALIGLAEAQVRVRPGPNVDVQVGPRQPEKPSAPIERSPLFGGLCVLVGIVSGFWYYFANEKGE